MNGLAMRAIAWIPAMLVGAAGVAHAGGDLARGEKLYEDCVACHPIERSVHGIGPTLYGILGRKAGEMADYRYSRALRDSGIMWTAEALDTFIADPQASVPANRMPYAGMPDAADRADLIAYLQKVSKSSAPCSFPRRPAWVGFHGIGRLGLALFCRQKRSQPNARISIIARANAPGP